MVNVRNELLKQFCVKEPTSVIHPQTISAASNSVDKVKSQFGQSK